MSRMVNKDRDIGIPEGNVVIVDPYSDAPKKSAWDILGCELGVNSIKDKYISLTHVDINGDEYCGTSDVETDVFSFEQWSEKYDENVMFEISFSVYIQDDTEDWSVTLEEVDDIVLLNQLLISKGIDIQVKEDGSVLEYKNNQLLSENMRLKNEKNQILRLMEGFSTEKEINNWKNCPTIPAGIDLVRVLNAWLKKDCSDYTQVEFVSWLLKGRSHQVYQYLVSADKCNANNMKEKIKSLMSSEYKSSKMTAGMPSTSYIKWKKHIDELKVEFAWIFTL
ncbi:MAG: hypothetical protein ABW087_17175 [Candidatus Thiodiazotropha sp.]